MSVFSIDLPDVTLARTDDRWKIGRDWDGGLSLGEGAGVVVVIAMVGSFVSLGGDQL